jgi:hypothetical protein
MATRLTTAPGVQAGAGASVPAALAFAEQACNGDLMHAISPQRPGAPSAHAAAERPWESSYSMAMDLLQRISIDPAVR